MNLLKVCKMIAMTAHESVGQKRKGSDTPYYVHPISVEARVKEVDTNLIPRCAALLHDVLEDTQLTAEGLITILRQHGYFGQIVDSFIPLVVDLSDQFKSDSRINRNWRVAAEIVRHSRDHGTVFFWLVKCADMLDNLKSIETVDKGFLPIFLKECWVLFEKMPPLCRPVKLYDELLSEFNKHDLEWSFKSHRTTLELKASVEKLDSVMPKNFIPSHVHFFLSAEKETARIAKAK